VNQKMKWGKNHRSVDVIGTSACIVMTSLELQRNPIWEEKHSLWGLHGFCSRQPYLTFTGTVANAGQTILVTYDISGSMYATKKSQDRFYLSAGEFRSLAEAVAHLVFYGNPTEHPRIFRACAAACFFPMLNRGRPRRVAPIGPTGRVCFTMSIVRKINAENMIPPNSIIQSEDIQSALLNAMPYPRNVPPDAQSRSNPATRTAFYQAFPGMASLLEFAELTAYQLFDEMARGSDEQPELLWIRVSDEDIDTTEEPDFKEMADQIRGQLFAYKKIYDRSKLEELFQFKAGGRIWVRVHRLAFMGPAQNGLSEKERKKLREEQEKLRRQIEELEERNEELLADKNKMNALDLMLGSRRLEPQSADCGLKFKRVKVPASDAAKGGKQRFFTTDKLRFIAGPGAADTDFRISKAVVEVQTAGSSPLAAQRYVLEQPAMGVPLELRLPDNEALRLKGKNILINVNYTYQQTNKQLTKRWVLDGVTFPGPGFFERFLVAFPTLGPRGFDCFHRPLFQQQQKCRPWAAITTSSFQWL
jgi:hypothetical protein